MKKFIWIICMTIALCSCNDSDNINEIFMNRNWTLSFFQEGTTRTPSPEKENYIIIDKDGYITLTDEGLSVAQKIYERHTLLSKALMMIGVDEKTAAEDACRIEHVISDKSFEHLKKYMEGK